MSEIKKLCVDLWEEYGKTVLIILGVIVALFVGGGIYRISKGEPFWGKPETASERSSRLRDCAQVANENLSPVQQMDSGATGVCEGFTSQEIDQTQAELGL